MMGVMVVIIWVGWNEREKEESSLISIRCYSEFFLQCVWNRYLGD
jgi:hypothetical protein